MIGTVKRLVKERGFGFIRDDNGVEYFFHRSGVRQVNPRVHMNEYDALEEGETVNFDQEDDGGKGPRATNVQRY